MTQIPGNVAPRPARTRSRVPNAKHQRFANEKFREFLANHDITIPVRDLGDMRKRALKKWLHRNPESSMSEATDETAPEFLNWITVTWIRHQCCEYDATLRWFSPSVRPDMHRLLKLHVLDLIATTYPELECACAMQARSLCNKQASK